MRIVGSTIFVALLLSTAAVAQTELPLSRRQLHIPADALLRGSEPFYAHAIHLKGVASPGATLDDVAIPLNTISKWGANAICFDLEGLSDTALNDDAIAAVKQLYGEFDWRRIAAICKVFPDDAPGDEAWRVAGAAAAAKGFIKALGPEQSTEIIYWIDGPHAEAAVASFKKAAPHLTVLAEDGGDLQAVASLDDASAHPLALATAAAPGQLPENASFILPDSEVSYAALEASYAHPLELEPWVPDNGILTEEQRESGWIALFDGKSLNGWIVTGQDDAWAVEDGEIHWKHRGGGVILTRQRFSDFELHFEWRIADGDNSGLFLRAPRENRQSKIGLEFQLFGDYGKPPHKNGSAALYDVLPPTENATKPAGEWNTTDITLKGSYIHAVVNGVTVHDLDMTTNAELNRRLREGFIGLQDHSGDVAFRNIRIKQL